MTDDMDWNWGPGSVVEGTAEAEVAALALVGAVLTQGGAEPEPGELNPLALFNRTLAARRCCQMTEN